MAGVDPHEAPWYLHPIWLAFAFAAAGAALFSLHFMRRRLAAETVVGLGYLIAGAAMIIILNSPRVTQEAHEVNDLLYGNAVAVPPEQLWIMASMTVGVLALHLALYRDFVFVSFDGEMARTLGYRTWAWNLLLFESFAMVVSASTRAIGPCRCSASWSCRRPPRCWSDDACGRCSRSRWHSRSARRCSATTPRSAGRSRPAPRWWWWRPCFSCRACAAWPGCGGERPRRGLWPAALARRRRRGAATAHHRRAEGAREGALHRCRGRCCDATDTTWRAAPPPSPIARAIQSLNPDLAVIIDLAGGYYSRDPREKRRPRAAW